MRSTRSIRHSCERCRQKKRKCPAEKPVCSLCARRGVACVYLGRRQRVEPPNSASSPVFEQQQQQKQPAEESCATRPGTIPETRSGTQNPVVDTTATSKTQFWTPSYTEPPPELLSHFTQVYRCKLDFQPLPLFDTHDLASRLLVAPRYLRWLFLALVLKFADHPFYGDMSCQASEFYVLSCRHTVIELANDGIAQLEVLQSLCMLALCEMKDGCLHRAWMTIGAAARLQSLQLLSESSSNGSDCRGSSQNKRRDTEARCYWSIAVLERLFSTSFLLSLSASPGWPESLPPPPHNGQENGPSGGIKACCLRAICLWGDVMAYLDDVRRVHSREKPWQTMSTHRHLMAKVDELDAQIPAKHLFRNVAVEDKTPDAVAAAREYWTPWFTVQLALHGILAALNNPFVHLVALRGEDNGSNSNIGQPRSFLQQTIDQALFHSSWVVRLLQIGNRLSDCEGESAHGITDMAASTAKSWDLGLSGLWMGPLVGQIVAVTATVPWFFQFATEPAVAEKAQWSYNQCLQSLGRIAAIWPHLHFKHELLHHLSSARTENGVSLRLPPHLLWQLLSPLGVTPDNRDPTAGQTQQDATVEVTAHYMPIAEETTNGHAGQTHGINYGGPSIDELLADSAWSDLVWPIGC